MENKYIEVSKPEMIIDLLVSMLLTQALLVRTKSQTEAMCALNKDMSFLLSEIMKTITVFIEMIGPDTYLEWQKKISEDPDSFLKAAQDRDNRLAKL